MSKNVKLVLVVLFVCTCIGFYFTPHLALHNIRKSAKTNDANALLSYIDFPAVRESFKGDLKDKFAFHEATSSEFKNKDPLAALGALLVLAFIDPMVDIFVTPENLATLIEGKNFSISIQNSIRVKSQPLSVEALKAMQKDEALVGALIHLYVLTEASKKDDRDKEELFQRIIQERAKFHASQVSFVAKNPLYDIERSMSYKGFNHFVVSVKKKGSSEELTKFIFKRDGFVSWKLSGLEIT